MRQNAKLDLRIVCIHEHIAILRYEYLADSTPKLHAHRNVLQVWLSAADSSRSCDGLIEFSVNTSVFPDKAGQSLGIGGIQLGQLTIIQDHLNHRIIRRQLLQHIRRSGITGLCLLSVGQLHPFKQDFPQLLRRINVEFFTGQLIDFLLQCHDFFFQLLSVKL